MNPLYLRQTDAFVARHHRTHKPARGRKFALGVCDEVATRAAGLATKAWFYS